MITKEELIEVLDSYFEPLFQIAGAALAFLVISFAVFVVIRPFIRKRF